MVFLKYALIVTFAGLWLVGLVDQIESVESVAKYLAISSLMVAVAQL